MRRPISWPVDSPLPPFFWPTACDSSESSQPSICFAVMLTASENSEYVSSSVIVLPLVGVAGWFGSRPRFGRNLGGDRGRPPPPGLSPWTGREAGGQRLHPALWAS